MNWDDLRIFLVLTRSGSLTQAARWLEIDQSTVGRRLSALEAALGTTLFLRSKVGLTLTEAGERILSDAIEMELRSARIAESIPGPKGGPVGELQIVSEFWILERLTYYSIPRLLGNHPQLNIRLSTRPVDARTQTAATVSLWFEEPPQMGEFAIKLVDVPFALYGPKDASDDADCWVAMQDSTGMRRDPARFMDRMRKPDASLSYAADDPRLVQRAISNGLGKGFMPVCLADEEPGLKRLGDADSAFERTLHLHAHPDTVQSLRVQTAIRELRENASFIFGSDERVGHTHLYRPVVAAKPSTSYY